MKNIKFKQSICVIAAVILLTACSAKPNSIDYYENNLNKAEGVAKMCTEKLKNGKKLNSHEQEDCANAETALDRASMISFKNGH